MTKDEIVLAKHGNALRLTPPLNTTKAGVDEFVSRLDASFAAVSARVAAGVA